MLGALVGMTLTQTLISDFLSVTVLILSQLMCPLASRQSHYCSTLYGSKMGWVQEQILLSTESTDLLQLNIIYFW